MLKINIRTFLICQESSVYGNELIDCKWYKAAFPSSLSMNPCVNLKDEVCSQTKFCEMSAYMAPGQTFQKQIEDSRYSQTSYANSEHFFAHERFESLTELYCSKQGGEKPQTTCNI